MPFSPAIFVVQLSSVSWLICVSHLHSFLTKVTWFAQVTFARNFQVCHRLNRDVIFMRVCLCEGELKIHGLFYWIALWSTRRVKARFVWCTWLARTYSLCPCKGFSLLWHVVIIVVGLYVQTDLLDSHISSLLVLTFTSYSASVRSVQKLLFDLAWPCQKYW